MLVRRNETTTFRLYTNSLFTCMINKYARPNGIHGWCFCRVCCTLLLPLFHIMILLEDVLCTQYDEDLHTKLMIFVDDRIQTDLSIAMKCA